MSYVQTYVLQIDHDVGVAQDAVNNTVKDLESQKSTLIEVVQSLGPFISEDDPSIRARAVRYLSAVIGQLPRTFLSRQQTQVICQFLCDRIEDEGALTGLSKLQACDKYTGSMATVTFRALISTFRDLQKHAQNVRLHAIQLLNDLMLHHRKALKEMGSESIIGITDFVSGEKDPRNLMIIFSIVRVVILEWDISGHAEILFETVFCYFPITFRPPPNDPYGITAQDLKNRLRDCIAGSQLFAPFVFPQLIDKLDSTSANVKKDVLQTISACVSSYGLATVSNYAITLWDSIKFEILNVQEEDLAEEALKSVQAIGSRLAKDLNTVEPSSPLANYLRPILKECQEQFQEPTHKQAKPSGHVVQVLANVSSPTFSFIARSLLPSFMTIYQDADSISKQRALLEILNFLLDSAIIQVGTTGSPAPPKPIENPLTSFKERLFEIGSQALMGVAAEEVSFRITSLHMLLKLCLLRDFLEHSEIGMIVQYLNEIILGQDPNGRDDLRKEAISALVQISKVKPSFVMDVTIPALMARLPAGGISGIGDFILTLEALAQISTQKHVSSTVIRRLLNNLETILHEDGKGDYVRSVLSTIYYIFSRTNLSEDENIDFYFEKVVVSLVGRLATASAGNGQMTALNEAKTLEVLGRIITKIVAALDPHRQKSTAAQAFTLFVEESSFRPVLFRDTATEHERSTMIISTCILAGVRPDVPIILPASEEADYDALLQELTRLALVESMSHVQLSILRQIGLVVSKFLSSTQSSMAFDLFLSTKAHLDTTRDGQENQIKVMFWIARSLILRLLRTDAVLQDLSSLLAIPAHSTVAARGFSLLLAPDEIVTKQNGANIRLLAKQKIFSICVPHIAGEFRKADTAVRPNYLVALSGILRYVPTEVVMPEIGNLLPLLLQSLDLSDQDVKAATIDNLTLVAQESPEAVEEHIGSLISRLLKSIGEPTQNSVKVRLAALKSLKVLPRKIKEPLLLRYKAAITQGLMVALDDPKRHVRKAAVDCRAAWFALDEPVSD